MIEILNMMGHAVSNLVAKALFEQHTDLAMWQIDRLHETFSMLDIDPLPIHSAGIRGIVDEIYDLFEMDGISKTSDIAFVFKLVKLVHYEIAGFTTLFTLAANLGYRDIAQMLDMSVIAEDSEEQNILNRLPEIMRRKAA